jgi:hypothetical protein
VNFGGKRRNIEVMSLKEVYDGPGGGRMPKN